MARQLVLAYGYNPTAYQILNPGMELWFSAAGDGVVGFVDRPGVRVAAGNPVSPLDRLHDVTQEFEVATARTSRRVCYLGADARLEELLHDSPNHCRLVVGAQPIVNPRHWAHTVAKHASLRAQLNRARNKSVEVHEWFAAHATNHTDLARCLREWIASRGLPPLHFLVEPDTLEQLEDRHVFVAQLDGRVVGFLVASPIPLKHGWQIEQLIRGSGAPNGSMELLVDGAIRSFATKRVEYVALGAAPLSEQVPLDPDTPSHIRALLALQRAHARRFYNFQGLERFKAKFDPERWEPVFAISTEERFSLSTLYAIAGAYCGQSPVWTVYQAGTRVVAQQASWLWKKVSVST